MKTVGESLRAWVRSFVHVRVHACMDQIQLDLNEIYQQ